MKDDDQESFEIETMLYAQSVDYGQLPEVCESLLRGDTEELVAKLLVCEKPLLDALPSQLVRRSAEFETKRISRMQVSGSMRAQVGRGARRRTIEGQFAVFQHPALAPVSLVVSDGGGEFMRLLNERCLRWVHPRPSAPVLRSPQLESLVGLLQANGMRDLRVRQLGQKARLEAAGPANAIETDRQWTNRDPGDVFERAREQNAWITDLAVLYGVGAGDMARLRVGRYGQFTMWQRARDAFAVIESAAVMAAERFSFLRDRARSAERGFRSRPFVIRFPFPALNSQEDVRRLHRAILGLPRTACTLLHGNPFYHAALSDYGDGSMFEVVGVASTYLLVIPQGRATVRSLSALCGAVFAGFQEGELGETSELAG